MGNSISITLKKLKDMGFEPEYRDNKESVFGNPYICGYLMSDDISIQIKYGTEWTSFVIEHMGNTRMNKGVKNVEREGASQCFIYILQELLDSIAKFKESVGNFPELTKQNHRDSQIEKLFEKNTYIPLVP